MTASIQFNVLICCPSAELRDHCKLIVERTYPDSAMVVTIDQIQDAVKRVEANANEFQLVLFEHNNPSMTLVKAFLEINSPCSKIMISNGPKLFELVREHKNSPEFLDQNEVLESLQKTLKKLATSGKIPPLPILDEDTYLPTDLRSLLTNLPTNTDVYARVAQGRYVRIFNKGSLLTESDIQKYENKAEAFFYRKKSEAVQALKEETERLEKISKKETLTPGEAKKEFSASFQTIRDVVQNAGFTPEAQQIAKASVAMSIKALGSKPKLSNILNELKKKEGNYIASHSFMVGQVACALAQKIGWSSAATFFKLSLASFLHDISLNSDEMAQIESIAEAEASNRYTAKDILQLKLHPMKAAEYSRQFSEIPSDVDQILAQHHERADGSGFPRSMNGKMISPLAALFVMAHDVVHAVYRDPSTQVDDFFEKNSDRYQVGQFKKILSALKNGATPES